MTLETIFLFNIFRAVALISALVVVSSRSPMQSVFSLILVFCSAAGMSLMLQAEFLALAFIIIYVGAIAVLFLFVVMMLNTKLTEVKSAYLVSFPYSTFLITVAVLEISLILLSSFSRFVGRSGDSVWGGTLNFGQTLTIESIGLVLYTHFSIPFILSGVILFLAMLGSVSLTLLHRTPTRREDLRKKFLRTGLVVKN